MPCALGFATDVISLPADTNSRAAANRLDLPLVIPDKQPMRDEIKSIAAEIKQSLDLLRRHL